MVQCDWGHICNEVRRVAIEAGEYITIERKRFSVDKIEVKGEQDFVSYVDKGAEDIIVVALESLIPDAGFVAEEGGGRIDASAPYQWIIDPLDGTTNFMHGLPPYAVSIALWDTVAREVVVGVVYEITMRECFYSWKGAKGAFMNEETISVSVVPTVSGSLVITGLAYGMDEVMVEHFERSFAYFNQHSHGARRLGSAATDLIYVACGRAEAFYQLNLSPWDVAAGAFIVLQAGGRVTDFYGGDDYTYGRSVVSTNALVRDEVFELVAGERFKKDDCGC